MLCEACSPASSGGLAAHVPILDSCGGPAVPSAAAHHRQAHRFRARRQAFGPPSMVCSSPEMHSPVTCRRALHVPLRPVRCVLLRRRELSAQQRVPVSPLQTASRCQQAGRVPPSVSLQEHRWAARQHLLLSRWHAPFQWFDGGCTTCQQLCVRSGQVLENMGRYVYCWAWSVIS